MNKILVAAIGNRHRTALTMAISVTLLCFSVGAGAQQNVGAGSSGGTSTVFATGNFVLPEQITAAPSSFGGGYLVSDANADSIYQIGPNGGAATVFSSNGFRDFAGTQLSSYYNGTSLAGQYLEVGSDGRTNGIGDLISSAGVATGLLNVNNSFFSGVATAPSSYGSIQSGQVVIASEIGGANGAGQIDVLNKDGSVSPFAAFPQASKISPGFAASGVISVGFAPGSFGQYGGSLFAGDVASGNLYVVNAQGQSSLFAQITLPAGASSPGLRQFAWAPSGFGQYSGDLFVSIAAQNGGGGSVGEIEVFNSSGQEVAIYDQGSAAQPLDPRGLLFTTIGGQTELLAANADPEVDVVTPSSFVSTAPEIDPTSAAGGLVLLVGGLVVLQGRRRPFFAA
jgi:hypothetical protein